MPNSFDFDASNILTLLIIIVSALILIILLLRNIRVVPQAKTYIIERLGAYHKSWPVGLHVKLPIVDKVAAVVSLKEDILDFPPQPVITKDNVTFMIDTVIFYQITDPKLYTYGISNPKLAIANLTTTTLRNIIGEMDLDDTLTSRDKINTKMRIILDEVTDAWGIKVNRVELKNIKPPADIQQAMERQMKADREKRESVLRAEGEKRSSILVAEGQKQTAILKAEAEKESALLRAEAAKQAMIKEAEGKAEAILKVNEARAEGLKMIKEVAGEKGLIAIKSLDTMEKVADGKATKLIIPSELQSMAGLSASLKEIITDQTTNK